ncbi:Major Facilitator Superfamily protein [Pseudohyphozyma bogoriensis]|nr:Major Facilitator Superfamily protein [Pseudohyphozyma bogoriensis]
MVQQSTTRDDPAPKVQPSPSPSSSSSSMATVCDAEQVGDLERGADKVEPQESREQQAENKDVIWVHWDGPDDPANPLNWPKKRKWLVSWMGIGFCTLVSATVSGYSIAAGSMETELHASRLLVTSGISLFTIMFGSAPLVLAPISEVYGRLGIYLLSSVLFTLLFIPQALAPNIEAILINRFLSGIFGSSAVSLVGGTLSDVWVTSERGLPMALFSYAAFAATGLGPTILGIVEQKYQFRIVFWILFAISGAFTVAICLVMRETRASVLLSRKAARLRKETGDDRYQSKDDFERGSFKVMMKTSLTRPLHMLFTEPALIAFTLWISFAWAVLYVLIESISTVFGGIYGFSISESGYAFSTQIVGATLGLIVNHFGNKLYEKHVSKRGAEARLYNAFFGGIIMPAGAWLYAWTARASGAVAPLFTLQMYQAMGIAGGGSLLAGIATVLAATPFLLYRYGERLRSRSSYVQAIAKMQAS